MQLRNLDDHQQSKSLQYRCRLQLAELTGSLGAVVKLAEITIRCGDRDLCSNGKQSERKRVMLQKMSDCMSVQSQLIHTTVRSRF